MMLTVQGLRFSYGQHAILKDVDLALAQGQLVFLVGANGSGKTTLLRLLLGQLKAEAGSIRVAGKDMAHLHGRERAGMLGYIPQNHGYSYDFTVADMVLMGKSRHLRWHQRPGAVDRQAMQESLQKVGAAHLQDRLFLSLSGGERQLVLLARALMQDARILLMDEVSANLDLHHQLMVMQMAKRLSRVGYLVLVTTHQLEWAFRYADTLLVLEEGRITPYDDLHSPQLLAQLSRVYGCELVLAPLSDGQTLVVPSASQLQL